MHYGTAKAVFKFFLYGGWILLVLGSLIAASAILDSRLVLALPGAYLMILGVFLVAGAQFGLAQIATAENTYAIYELLKTKIDNPHNGATLHASAGAKTVQSMTKDPQRIKVYKGREILRAADGVMVDGNKFSNVLEAEKWISSQDSL
jgi:hypothetical protein